MHSVHGNHWVALSRLLNNKTDNDAKNHFYTLLKKQASKILISDSQFLDQIETIQAMYFTQYISEYFCATVKPKRDYMYNIICEKKINKTMTENYVVKMRKEYPFFINIGINKLLKNVYSNGLMAFDLKKPQLYSSSELIALIQSPHIDYEYKVYFVNSWLSQLASVINGTY